MTTDSKASDVEARERENFERVHAGKLHLDRLANGNYWSSITDDRWHGWLARASQQPSAQELQVNVKRPLGCDQFHKAQN